MSVWRTSTWEIITASNELFQRFIRQVPPCVYCNPGRLIRLVTKHAPISTTEYWYFTILFQTHPVSIRPTTVYLSFCFYSDHVWTFKAPSEPRINSIHTHLHKISTTITQLYVLLTNIYVFVCCGV